MKILLNGAAVIETDSHHRIWVEECGLIHDRWFADQICRHLSPGDMVIEGGANIGTLTRAMLDAGASVIAVEPNREAIECLKHNCPEATIFQVGLSSERGSAGFCRMENAGASHFSVELSDLLPLETIDNLSIARVRLIKLDIEGYELKALRGAIWTIARSRPVLIIEINREALKRAGDSDRAIFDFIEEQNYRWRIIQPDCQRGDLQYDIECLPGIHSA